MGILDNLFGKKSPTDSPSDDQNPAPSRAGKPPPLPPETSAGPPATIQVWDSDGRLREIPREEWQKNLPDNLKANWEKPDELAQLISTGLRDGFVAECLEGAEQLHRIDPKPHRGAALLGAALLDLQRFPDAETVLKEDLQKSGEDGIVLAHLAKAFAGQGHQERAERAMWRALEVDPNQDDGLTWFVSLQRKRGGAKAEREALRRVAALPTSWRAQLWLAREALESKDMRSAMAFYRESLDRQKPVTADALLQISGDLGNRGLNKELIETCAPLFDAKEHGLRTGLNLIKAHVDLRDAPSARQTLEGLVAQQRPDWREQLQFWEGRIDELDKPATPVSAPPRIEIHFLSLDGPIWTRASSLFADMLSAKPSDAVKIDFVCGSAELPPSAHGDKGVAPPSDAVGHFTRGLPMFLAERMHIKTSANVSTLVPWLKSGGFVLAGVPWTLETMSAPEETPDYVVFLHVVAAAEPWKANLSIVRTIDEKTVAEWDQEVDIKAPAEAISAITKHTLDTLHSLDGISLFTISDSLVPPTVGMLPHYVTGLAQALMVYCASFVSDARPFVYPERNIFDWLLDLCLRETDNVIMRMLLLSTLERESRAHSDVALEYREKIQRLQREHPLRESIQALTDAAVARIYPK